MEKRTITVITVSDENAYRNFMSWTNLGTLKVDKQWFFTPITNATYFRLTHLDAPPDTTFYVCQAERVGNTHQLFDIKEYPENIQSIIRLLKPPVLENRVVGIRSNQNNRRWRIEIEASDAVDSFFLTPTPNNPSPSGGLNWNVIHGKQPSGAYSINPGDRLLGDTTNGDINISIPSMQPGSEIEIVKFHDSSRIILNGLTKINSRIVSNTDLVLVNKSNTASTKLIYINDSIGWISLPNAGLTIRRNLNLPDTGLQQLFYASDIVNVADGQAIPQWNDTRSGRNATQSTISQQPTYNASAFPYNPGVKFNGNQFYFTDLTYLVNTFYTIAAVEKRSNTNQNYYFGHNNSSSNSALHIGYRGNTTFTLAQWNNDLDVAVAGYSSPTPVIWITSYNSRGFEIWRNNILIASRANTSSLVSGINGRLGAATNIYTGDLGLVATYTGNKSQQEIRDIFTAINNTFLIY